MKMSGALSLHFTRSTPMIAVGNGGFNHGPPVNFPCNSNRRLSTSMSMGQYRSSDSSVLTSTVGFTPSSSVRLSQGSFNCRHIQVLSFAACAAAISATWLFCSVIPTLLAFKRAAESLEKLMDVTREELPNTMAAIRLSGMEISDLTMELSDLGQEITQGVRKSTHVVRVAEERLRKLTNTNPSGPMQEKVAVNGAKEPVVARTVRGIRQGIVKGRGISQTIFTFGRFSKIAINYLRTRAKANA